MKHYIDEWRAMAYAVLKRLNELESEYMRMEELTRDNPLQRELLDLITLMPDHQTQEIIDYINALRAIRNENDNPKTSIPRT